MTELSPVQKKTVEFILSHIEKTGMPPTLREIASHFQWKAVGSAQDVVAALRKKGVLQSSAPGKSRQIVPCPDIFGGLFQYEPNAFATFPTLEKKSTKKQSLKQTKSHQSAHGPFLPGFEDFLRVPLLGQVQAGNPTEALEQQNEFITFPSVSRSHLRGGPLFALTIKGYSMVNAGFLPGDTVLVESTQTAQDRDIVVANVLYSEVTVKRLAQKGSALYQTAQETLKTEENPPWFLIPENPNFDPIPFGYQEDDRIVGVVRSLFRKNIL